MGNVHSIKHVIVKVSDPWDLGVQIKWQPLEATILAEDKEAVLIRLLSPFVFKGTTCEYLVASPRHEGTSIDEIQNGKNVFCGMTRITEQQANSENPLDLAQWRGGLAIIGDLEPLERTAS